MAPLDDNELTVSGVDYTLIFPPLPQTDVPNLSL